ncbi:MAG: hypothetical protein ACP5RH_01285 [Leptodesmis sp.]|uniref:hypothetical protein n=1 Tax=Leptodesmis sp. TaxID=3100501 RepID=UPI003D115479
MLTSLCPVGDRSICPMYYRPSCPGSLRGWQKVGGRRQKATIIASMIEASILSDRHF